MQQKKSTLEILRDARFLIAFEGWTQGPYKIETKCGTKFCSCGALHQAAGHRWQKRAEQPDFFDGDEFVRAFVHSPKFSVRVRYAEAEKLLSQAARTFEPAEYDNGSDYYIDYNEAENRTLDEVLAMFDLAITYAEQAEAAEKAAGAKTATQPTDLALSGD